jgi:hypothetical protein
MFDQYNKLLIFNTFSLTISVLEFKEILQLFLLLLSSIITIIQLLKSIKKPYDKK